MLTELHIENFAIIEHLDINFGSGLVALTGETGAGKSIIIDAVEVLLGGRAESIQIRSGEERASIEAVFHIPEVIRPSILPILEREDLIDDQEYLTIAREVRQNGRNVARVNGRSVSASLIREISENLIDIHGQSEHLSLLRVNQHLGLLDRFAATFPGNELARVSNGYTQTYHRLQELQHELADIRQSERDSARRLDVLNFQIGEIEAAHLLPDEDEQLLDERNRLANAESLARSAQDSLLALDVGTPESPAAIDLIGQVVQALTNLARLDGSQNHLNETAQGIFDNLTDLTRNIRQYLENIEFNPRRLDQVEERLASIQLLKRKYGDSITAILSFRENARRQLEQITHADVRIQELEAEREKLLDRLGLEGLTLSEIRHSASDRLEKDIEQELSDLHMSEARFQVDFQQQPDQSGAKLPDGRRLAYFPTGLEKIEFMIAPNPGEGFKPLAKIASGGETSRLMLALKNVLAQADHIPTLIFDEIDQGIGGKVGSIVGQKLRNLGRQHQVFCITHLPQLAAFGEQHYRVEKIMQHGRTITVVKPLEGDDRLLELAQMLGGVSEGTLQSARELIQTARVQAPAS
jgi:DNA repair protein RecN (Recombination protein N)